MSEAAQIERPKTTTCISTAPRNKWEEYEAGKRHIAKWSRSQAEYEKRVKELADMLGI